MSNTSEKTRQDSSGCKTFTSEELNEQTLDDGTRIVTSPESDIKRPVCAGIDVHKKILVAAICKTDPVTLKASFLVQSFSTSNRNITKMAYWMLENGVKDACMESTGKYWIPVYDILEKKGIKPVLTHPKYVKQAKGRKTDFKDAVHIANLFRMDLVVGSFIPPQDIRDVRELCRYRLKLTYVNTAEKNRFQNSMTVSKIRIDSVFRDPFGMSATRVMEYLINTKPEEVDDDKIMSLVDPKVKASREEILDSIHGYEFVGVQRDKMQIISFHMSTIQECMEIIDSKLDHFYQKYKDIVDHMATIPGITMKSALYILGEIGTDMSVWQDSAHLASWAGLSPANNESAKKKKSTRIGNGGHYLKPLLVQCALAAVKCTRKQPYFHYKYETIKKRRGHKKAVIAIARKMLVCIYNMVREGKDFQPKDYDQVMSQKNKHRELNAKNVINYLLERGVNPETISLVKEQMDKSGASSVANSMDKETDSKKCSKKTSKKKQSKSSSATTAHSSGKARRSTRNDVPSSNQSDDATA